MPKVRGEPRKMENEKSLKHSLIYFYNDFEY